ncbi:hypothetical protein KSS87_017333 [Heliosperma pusillum]|nr:hypothetical protein KSS87_017333 [Heliosperma pusillum]
MNGPERNITSTRKSDEEVNDSSMDYKGKLPLRACTGSWKASFFIIAIEFSEKMSYFGISTNMITYMTKVMHQDLETAANSVNLWTGVSTVTPLLGGFLADAYTGRFSMILFSALLYVLASLLSLLSSCPINMLENTGKNFKVIVQTQLIYLYLITKYPQRHE